MLVILNFLTISLGNVDDDTIFTYETGTAVYRSRAATLHGEFWVFGGSKKRQVVVNYQNTYLIKF